ncbi:MAG: poly-gamma-glutamate system protein [Deltaproteobacteria bacterium]|nr:poly-gamma-glutamate system protein [Deltaproteobacteria bacterium]
MDILEVISNEIKRLICGMKTFPYRFTILSVFLVLLWIIGCRIYDDRENAVMEKIKSVQGIMTEYLVHTGLILPDQPTGMSLLGMEWSPITTTLGDMKSKRTSTDPRWGAVMLRLFKKAGIKQGSKVAIAASGSFPGFVLSTLLAAKTMKCDIILLPSLGASSWGANRVKMNLADMITFLNERFILDIRPKFITPGGGGDIGDGIPVDGIESMKESASRAGVTFVMEKSFDRILERKWAAIEKFKPDIFVSIGGGCASLGTSPEILNVPGGLLDHKWRGKAGNGLIALALGDNIPTISLLHVRGLCQTEGIPFNPPFFSEVLPQKMPLPLCLLGILAFVMVIFSFSPWEKKASNA